MGRKTTCQIYAVGNSAIETVSLFDVKDISVVVDFTIDKFTEGDINPIETPWGSTDHCPCQA